MSFFGCPEDRHDGDGHRHDWLIDWLVDWFIADWLIDSDDECLKFRPAKLTGWGAGFLANGFHMSKRIKLNQTFFPRLPSWNACSLGPADWRKMLRRCYAYSAACGPRPQSIRKRWFQFGINHYFQGLTIGAFHDGRWKKWSSRISESLPSSKLWL